MFGDVLKKIREKNNLSQRALAEKINVSQQTVGSWETNRTSPSPEMIKKIAELFNISTDVLLGSVVKQKETTPKHRIIKMPVYGMVAAGAPILTVEDILDYIDIDEEDISDGEFRALRVKGDSMIPDIKSGDIVVVRRQPDIESGQIAVVIINGDEATVKKVIKHKDGIQLVATNPEYMPMFFSNKEIEDLPVSIFGRVVELRRKF